MNLRNTADYRTLVWVILMPIVALIPYLSPRLLLFTFPVSCYLALCAGVIAHNHNHCPTFKEQRLNSLFSHWLTVFYGYPTFAWIPTHNLNHHKFLNKKGDATITWRYTNKHNFFVAATYFFVSSYWQSDPIRDFIRKARSDNPRMYRRIIGQYVVWIGSHVTLFAIACVAHGASLGFRLWLLSFAVPSLFSLWTIIFFNYIQHVHADPWSVHNHSRSFEGAFMNFLLFNNGLHTVHHESPGTHWSRLPTLHKRIRDEIHPELCVANFGVWLIKTYILALVFPSMGTHQVGRPPFDAEDAVAEGAPLVAS